MSQLSLEKTILKSLLRNENYCRKVIPFLKSEYFSNEDKVLFEQINDFILKYNKRPTADALEIEINSLVKITEEEVKACKSALTSFDESKEETSEEWLIDKTETFCQEKAIYQAMMLSIEIMNGQNKTLGKGSIPHVLTEALSVSFDPNIGHDFFQDVEKRYDFYHRVEERIPFDLEFFNKITKGGLPKKTLNIILAGTGVGKSLAMCHFAAANLTIGKNVLYITMEMAEERIAERIDANLLNTAVDDLEKMPKDLYERKVASLKNKTNGKLIIKEYPTASASSQHFRTLLNELRLKKSFEPDIIYIDYLNICSSARMKAGPNVNSYTFIKAIAEELRGLAVEFDVPIISATQTTRGGYSNSDVGLEDTSESFGLPATADFMFALISTEQLEDLGQIMVKQLKNRYNDPTTNKRFVIGVDRPKMKLYDAEASAQNDIADSGQIQMPNKTNDKRDKFKGIKV
jgi:replicative DNA helicase